MINYFNFKEISDGYLITNELGRYAFISTDDFKRLVNDEITEGHPRYDELVEKFFVYDGLKSDFILKAGYAMRRTKEYLGESTQLFIFVVTTQCNLNCVYCQAKDTDTLKHGFMSKEVAMKALDIVFESPSQAMTIEFQGGEPLLNFDVIREVVIEGERRAQQEKRDLSFSVVSNLLLLDDEKMYFLKEHHVQVSTSLDGDEKLHNHNRHDFNDCGSYKHVVKSIRRLQAENIPVGCIETTTKETLQYAKELVDTYIALDMHNIFIRPLTPLGVAHMKWDEIGYHTSDFIKFYKESLQYIIALNKEGYELREGHARLFLERILKGVTQNYMELRSPCGASIGQMAFYYDGSVYTCDEGRMVAEMGEDVFKLGTIDDTYNELVSSSTCKSLCASSVIESLPECCDCVYHPYCGVCPVINYALYHDIFATQSNHYRCQIYKGMLDVIFSILESDEDKEVLEHWCDL